MACPVHGARYAADDLVPGRPEAEEIEEAEVPRVTAWADEEGVAVVAVGEEGRRPSSWRRVTWRLVKSNCEGLSHPTARTAVTSPTRRSEKRTEPGDQPTLPGRCPS